jgi:hypothetical protein
MARMIFHGSVLGPPIIVSRLLIVFMCSRHWCCSWSTSRLRTPHCKLRTYGKAGAFSCDFGFGSGTSKTFLFRGMNSQTSNTIGGWERPVDNSTKISFSIKAKELVSFSMGS